MPNYQQVSPLLVLMLSVLSLSAQESSKSKAANKLYEKGTEVELYNTTQINTDQLEFSPTFYLNGIVYASSRLTQGERDKKIDETYFELYYADLDGNGEPLAPREFSLELNSPLHEGPVTFDREGQKMYFTRNNLDRGIRRADEQGVTRLKIYEATKGRNDWKEVRECSFNGDSYSTCHPTLSSDGEVLYFASDRAGGQGGMDLYRVRRVGDQWSEPENLGPEINTAGNEVFPFIHSSGHLFFASDGYAGMGGLDLHMIALDQGKKVINLGEPFNSEADDLGFILNPEGTQGFFSSDRAGGSGKDDIYRFRVSRGIWGMTRPTVFPTTIRVVDAATKMGLSGAEVRVFERTADGFLSGGKDLYEAVLLPSGEAEGQLLFQLIRKDAGSLGTADAQSNAEGLVEYAFPGERKFLVLVTKDGYTPREAGFSTLGNDAQAGLTVALKKRSCVLCRGSVVDQSTGRTIPNAVVRIRNTIMGTETAILATELGTFSHCLPLDAEYRLTGIKENFQAAELRLSTLRNDGSEELRAELTLSPTTGRLIDEGSVIVLENIYYDFDKSDIRAGAARELEELRAMMETYPSVEIELVAHTDSRGHEDYNQQLSQRRAESARAYLIARGIAAPRIRAIGLGESQLRNDCGDGRRCSEAEHQYNRRSEVRVLKVEEAVKIRYGG
ncbi:MAG: OmpA family protein [Bacteroidota bacterium]